MRFHLLKKKNHSHNLSTRTKSTHFDNDDTTEFFPLGESTRIHTIDEAGSVASHRLSGHAKDHFHDESVMTKSQQQPPVMQIKTDQQETEENELFRDTFSFVMTLAMSVHELKHLKKKLRNSSLIR